LKKIENSSDEYPDITAADVLNTYTEKQLIDMFVLNSEISVPTSTKIAEEVVRMRKNKLRQTSTELNKLTMKLNYSARVAAIVFQALRIEVNQEFQNIKLCIDECQKCVKDGGILMILSYHSGEDRIVKEVMKRMKEEGIGEIVTKNAIPPSYHEVVKNKPSRSARLRVFRYT
jgi:16S rRNA (cytosine1402-N4)-methyltransferase